MQNVYCDECLRTYKPYTYNETLQRAIVSGVEEWQGVDDQDHIARQYNEYLFKSNSNRQNQHLTKIIRNLFPSVHDFMLCHKRFHKERRTKISAKFLCFDCEKYLCTKCITQHSEHFTFSEDDKNNMVKWDDIETKIQQAFNAEGDTKEDYIKQEREVLCNIVDVRDSVSVTEWEGFTTFNVNNACNMPGWKLDSVNFQWDFCILNDNQTFLVLVKYKNTRIKMFNISSYELIGTIKLLIGSIEWPYIPAGITEIPSTDPSQTLIAVSFPSAKKIGVINIHSTHAQVVSSINIQGQCYDLAYCNNKLITRCWDYLDGKYRHSIHVMDMAGEIINIIDLHKAGWLYDGSSMSVHSESETIYVCHGYDCVTWLSLPGQVLHSIMFIDLFPHNICVDRDQNVYVMGYSLPLYRLSSDLSERVKIIDKDAVNVDNVTSIKHHKNKIYMVSMEGFVYIFSVD